MSSGLTSIADYIFIDERRLDLFFAQISPPLKYEKIPKISAELSIAGPKVAGSQERPSRPFTTHEKIIALVNSELIGPIHMDITDASPKLFADWTRYLFERGAKRNSLGTRFVLSRLDATRIQIPKSVSGVEDFDGLNVWVQRGSRAPNQAAFFLVEDSPGANVLTAQSGISGLWHLLGQLGGVAKDGVTEKAAAPSDKNAIMVPDGLLTEVAQAEEHKLAMPDFRTEELRGLIVQSGLVTTAAKFISRYGISLLFDEEKVFSVRANTKSRRIILKRERERELSRQMFTNPVELLAELGAGIGYTRTIDTLFLVRSSWMEMSIEGAFTFIGYPLFIVSSPSPFI